MLWVLINNVSFDGEIENYPLIIHKYPPYLFYWRHIYRFDSTETYLSFLIFLLLSGERNLISKSLDSLESPDMELDLRRDRSVKTGQKIIAASWQNQQNGM